jgi:hypothetical protein
MLDGLMYVFCLLFNPTVGRCFGRSEHFIDILEHRCLSSHRSSTKEEEEKEVSD